MSDFDIERYGSNNILVLDNDKIEEDQFISVIGVQLADFTLKKTSTKEELEAVLNENPIDIVILNTEFSISELTYLIHSLRLLEHEPSTLALVESVNPQAVASLYDVGCDCCLVKHADWLSDLGPAVAAISRQRRMQGAATQRLSQLTEFNRVLKEKNRRLDEFSMTIAHDIRGPLAGISMNLEYIIDTYAESIPEQVKDLISKSLATSRRLTDIVQAMYGYAKLGAKAAKMGQVNLTTLIPEVIKDLNFINKENIKINVGEMPNVWGSAELLSRVFLNLISNAVKYSDKNNIIIDIGLEGISEQTLARFAEVYVQDNGPGIQEADLKDIFKMFKRSCQAKDGKEGLGVGLAIVERIVELHYGQIRVESVCSDRHSHISSRNSDLKQGTKFIISLPMEKNEI